MAQVCEHCHKGISYGHAVSHAKNRTRRIFHPNLQKLKVVVDGIVKRVKLCTRCIKRLRRDKRLGAFLLPQIVKVVPVTEAYQKKIKVKVATPLPTAPTLDISSIVGKKS